MTDGKREILVEEVSEELAHPVVGPAAVYQQQALQEAELRNRVVRGQYRLHALLARDAHAYMRRCNQYTTSHIFLFYHHITFVV